MNSAISTMLFELSVLYGLKGVPFKPRALERASQAIGELSEDVQHIYTRDGAEGLEKIPGVGPGIAERIVEYIKTKHIREYERMKKSLPADIAGILSVEGIGPKTLALLYRKLGVTTRAKLEKLAHDGKLAGVKGIGEKGQAKILRALNYQSQSKGRFSPGLIWPQLRAVADQIESWPHVKRLELVGSLRRMQETIGDLDMLAISDDTEDTLRRFVSLPQVQSVYTHGHHNALVRIDMGIDADLWVLPAESYGAALIAWTGSKEHNVHLRTIAKRKKYMLDDYGLFRGTKMIAGASEESVYKALGLQYIPPELRTDGGEIEAAAKSGLPKLVGYSDVQGDLQVQTSWTDGEHSILDMAKAAHAAGLKYIAITDHTKSLTIARGLDEKQIKKQWAEIDRVQKHVSSIRILKGSECDIRKDGTLDLPDVILAQLDVVGISVHSHFGLTSEEQTQRIMQAMSSPHADILFHPTGRKILQRQPYELDMTQIIAHAKKTKTVLEANAHPARLDLNGEYIRMAIDAGVRISIDTDAHAAEEFSHLRWGIGQARRGWARESDVINTRTVTEMLKLLK